MECWKVIESGKMHPEEAMAKDAALLGDLDQNNPSCLHFYEWEGPSLTYGYFTDPSRYLNYDALNKHGIRIGRRPTGGGMIFHFSDFAFSVLLNASHFSLSMNPLQNYAYINLKVAKAIFRFSGGIVQPDLLQEEPTCSKNECLPFCMAKPTRYDIFSDGKKIGGAAQRRTKQGLLHQTSLNLLYPSFDLIREILLDGDSIANAMEKNSGALLPYGKSDADMTNIKSQLRQLIIEVFFEK